jgi:hypothetical protein
MSVQKVLELEGYYYVGQVPLESMLEEFEESEEEDFMGWRIQSYPVFAVGHIATGHYWMPWGDATEDVEAVKSLIRKGFDLAAASVK